MQDTVEFLNRIYSGFDLDGVFTIIHIGKWEEQSDGTFKKRSRADVRVFRYEQKDIPDIDWAMHLEANSNRFDIYFGSMLRHSDFIKTRGASRGKLEDCQTSTCLVMDIDFQYPGAHESDKLPKDIDEATPIIDLGPVPSMMLDSGYGVHLYWIYLQNIICNGKLEAKNYGERRKAAHGLYKTTMKERGWKLDSTYTPERIWRLPGFKNWKIPTTPRDVTVIYGLDGEVEKHDFDELSPKKQKSIQTAAPKPLSSSSVLAMPKAQSVENLPGTLKAYAQKYEDDALLESDVDDAEESKQKSDYIRRLLKGSSIEEKGNRDFALTKICGIICYLTREVTEFTRDDLEYIVNTLMRPSLEAWVGDSEGDTNLEREMEKAVDKLTRIKAKDTDNQDAGLRELAKALRTRRNPKSPLDSEVSGSEPEEELDRAGLLQCGLIKHGTFTYVWDWPNNRYYKRFVKEQSDLRAVLRDCWPEADRSCPFKHSVVNEDGKSMELATAQLERLYSRAAEGSHYSFCVPQTCFDEIEREFIINPAPYRQHEPVHNEDINKWLKLLGGEKYYETLCDWLAGLLHLNKPCAALYFDGPPGCGKSLFGLGATQLWSDIVPLYESMVDRFNQALLTSPVCLVDEGINSTNRNSSMVLRRLIAQGSHAVNWKGGPLLKLHNHIRIVIAANNDRVLLSGREEKLSEADAHAMSERIIYMKIDNDDARNFFIDKNRGDRLTASWIKGGGFARHVLWLGANRDLSNTGRFLVQGSSDRMANKFSFQGEERGEVLDWIVEFCDQPDLGKYKVSKNEVKAAEIGNGIVAVNVSALYNILKAAELRIPRRTLLEHISAVASSSVQVRTGNVKARYQAIPVEKMIEYADTFDIGDVDRIREHASRETDITRKIIESKNFGK